MRDTGQAEDRPGGIVRMAGHAHTYLLTHGDNFPQEVGIIFEQLVRIDALIQLQCVFQLRETLRLPAGQGEAVGTLRRPPHNLQRGHASQLLLVIVQAVGAVLRDQARQIGAQPVQHRHEIVDNHLHAVLGEISDGGFVVFNVPVAGRQAELDILVDVDALNHLARETVGLHQGDVAGDLLLRPHLSGGLVIEKTHDPRHAGYLADLRQSNGVAVFSVPAKGHFHFSVPLFLFIFSAFPAFTLCGKLPGGLCKCMNNFEGKKLTFS